MNDHVRALLLSCNTTIKTNILLFSKRDYKEGPYRVVERSFPNRLRPSAPQTGHSPGGTRTEAGRQNSETYLQHCLGSRIDSGGGGLLNSVHKTHCRLLCYSKLLLIFQFGFVVGCVTVEGVTAPKFQNQVRPNEKTMMKTPLMRVEIFARRHGRPTATTRTPPFRCAITPNNSRFEWIEKWNLF